MQKFVAGGGPVVNYDWNHDENLRLCMLQAYNQATECRHQKKIDFRLACLLACLHNGNQTRKPSLLGAALLVRFRKININGSLI